MVFTYFTHQMPLRLHMQIWLHMKICLQMQSNNINFKKKQKTIAFGWTNSTKQSEIKILHPKYA